jgi:hypothetical protein
VTQSGSEQQPIRAGVRPWLDHLGDAQLEFGKIGVSDRLGHSYLSTSGAKGRGGLAHAPAFPIPSLD